MPITDSPLRYPGGKYRLWPTIERIVAENKLTNGHYVEPFCGGAGIALKLLYRDIVWKAHLNDLSPHIYAFWHTVLNNADWLCDKIRDIPIDIKNWEEKRAIYLDYKNVSMRELGFATLFLNRTNRSGILSGGVIGGKHQQGRWKIGARFNKKNIIEKLQKINRYKNRIKISNMDARKYLENELPKLPKNTLLYCDPPYFDNGKELYDDFFERNDHVSLAKQVGSLSCPWVITYDAVSFIEELYESESSQKYSLQHSAHRHHLGAELFISSKDLVLPEDILS